MDRNGKYRILIAEDSPMQREFIGHLLQPEGLEVTFAVDGAAALREMEESCPDLLVTDFRMPELDGISLIREIKCKAELSELPVILMTSDNKNKISQIAKTLKVVFLPKDELVTTLCGMIRHLLGESVVPCCV